LTHIEPPQVPETVQPYYKPEELQLVLRSLRGRRLRGIDAARTRAILLVLFETGLRASELCAVRVEDIDWDAQTIVVREAKGAANGPSLLGRRRCEASCRTSGSGQWTRSGSSRPWMGTG
jgi:integrase